MDHSVPGANASFSEWLEIFDSSSKWERCVSSIYYTYSVCDKFASPEVSSLSNNIHVCMQCAPDAKGDFPAWPSIKALESHTRAKHKSRTVWREYVGADGVCPACKSNFKSRLRCIAHLSDKRRTKCSALLLSGAYTKLSAETVSQLDLHDRESRKLAQRAGHSHVIASAPATNSSGVVIGRVCA